MAILAPLLVAMVICGPAELAGALGVVTALVLLVGIDGGALHSRYDSYCLHGQLRQTDMETTNRGALVVGTLLIGTGLIFLLVNLLPGVDLTQLWPGIFVAVALAMLLPPWILPSHRNALAGLLIPGTILLVLGAIFSYQVLTGDWDSWTYVWALIPGSVGAGMWAAARAGYWGSGAATVGLWMLGGSLVAFVIFAAFLGGDSPLARGAPVALIALGLIITASSLVRPRRN